MSLKPLVPLIITLSLGVVKASKGDKIGNVFFDDHEKCGGPRDPQVYSYINETCIDREIKGSLWIYGPYGHRTSTSKKITGCMYLYPNPGCGENDENDGHQEKWNFGRHDQCASVPQPPGETKTWQSAYFTEEACDWGFGVRLESDCIMELVNGETDKEPSPDGCIPAHEL